ncbi:MAG: SpoIIE family protein phosphatase, partial [Butyrivibrio sp.]|nr:SpoIIE family protein phosphatase [Butyrivibrio sp.]
MKKIFGRTFGSIQKKMVNLVMGILIITVIVFGFLSFFQMKMLSGVVQETRSEQEQSISVSSRDTMNQVLDHSMVNSTGLQAEVVDNDFLEVVHNVSMLQSMAQGLWENRNSVEPLQVDLPDPSNDGTLSAMALCEEGVDPTKSEYLGVIGHLAIPMIAMVKNSDKLQACYIGLADGTHLGIDSMSSDKLDENGELIPFPVRERPWYKGAVEKGGISFTGIMTDAYNGKMCITCSAPIICDGELIGVAGADIILESMTQIIQASKDIGGFSFVVNDSGKVVLAPEDNGLFSAKVSEEAEDLRETGNSELTSFINDAFVKATDIKVIAINGKEYYAAGTPLPTVGWALIAIVDKEITEASEKQLLEEYDQINMAASSRFRSGTRRIMIYSIVIILLIAVIGFFTALLVSHRITKPIEEMTKDINNSSAAGNLFEMKDAYRTDDEIEILAEAFADLSQKTKKYIQDITIITKEKERVSTELMMANQIQKSMLPSVFPAFPKKKEFDIYASMDPAREVGGDFYDFFLIDDDHLCLVMADVSGKGVPAALFMMITKVILQSCAMLGKNAAE